MSRIHQIAARAKAEANAPRMNFSAYQAAKAAARRAADAELGRQFFSGEGNWA